MSVSKRIKNRVKKKLFKAVYTLQRIANKHTCKDCICYDCDVLKNMGKKQEELTNEDCVDCGCENSPFYDKDACESCKNKSFCDVPANPELYTFKE